MSEKNAKLWLQKHTNVIPALACNHEEITQLLANEKKSSEIVKHVINDPGLCLALLIKVNSRRGSYSSRDIVESPTSAIALLGDEVSHRLFKTYSVAEEKISDPDQLFLFYQLINRSLHNVAQAEQWATRMGFHNMDLIRTSALLAFAGELLCCIHDFAKYRLYIQAKSDESYCLELFGFSFANLNEVLIQKTNLPGLILHSQKHRLSTGQHELLLKFTARLCHECEYGWYRNEMMDFFEQFSEWLQLPLERVMQDTQAISIKAARSSIVKDAWQPASRLILIKDSVWSDLRSEKEKQRAASASRREGPLDNQERTFKPSVSDAIQDVFTQLYDLVKQPDCSQSEVLSICFKSIIHDIAMSRASLLMLSKDGKNLQNRMNIGVPKDSPLRQFSIETEKSGLLKILLSKPQAIWINKDNLTKYQRHIPNKLTGSTSRDYFLAMSLFIDAKPFAIVYSDRAQDQPVIDREHFAEFKKLILYTSKALTLLSKR